MFTFVDNHLIDTYMQTPGGTYCFLQAFKMNVQTLYTEKACHDRTYFEYSTIEKKVKMYEPYTEQ